MFPFSITGTVHIQATMRGDLTTAKAVMNRIANLLKSEDASEVYVEGHRVRFTNTFFRDTDRYNILAPFGSGTFDIAAAVDGISMRYALSMVRTILTFAALFACIVLVTAGEILRAFQDDSWRIVAIPFALVYTIVYAVSWMRISFWLMHGLEELTDLRQT